MAVNFREFSGGQSAFGGALATGRLFRGAAPFEPLLLESHNFRTIVDFRHPDEAEVSWDAPWANRVVRDDGRVGVAPHLAIVSHPAISAEVINSYYHGIFTNLPFEDRYRSLFASGLRSLAEHEGGEAALVCCSAGKDRTGMFVALFATILGIDRDTILADFMKSGQDQSLLEMVPTVKNNVLNASGKVIDDELAERMLGVKPTYLEAFFCALDDRCRGVAGYLDLIGVDDAVVKRLRRNWLA